MKHVFIAGATGYLGRHLCAEFHANGWHVTALVRSKSKVTDLPADRIVEAEATWRETLHGTMQGIDLVVSALGITRQADGLSYWDVDYQANLNLLDEAVASGVTHFAYAHVLHADRMSHVPLVAAKSAFVRKLQTAPISHTVIAPTGYFSDMSDFFDMARQGRVWLFGAGQLRINPIHGADLAHATRQAIEAGETWLDVGGPDMFTHEDLAKLAFDSLGKSPRITHLPDWTRRLALRVIPHVTPRHISGPAQFFLSAIGLPMTAKPHGTRHLDAFFESKAQQAD